MLCQHCKVDSFSPRVIAPTISPSSLASNNSNRWATNNLSSPAGTCSEGEYDFSSSNQQCTMDDTLDFNWDNPWPRPPVLKNEETRLKVLSDLNILDTSEEEIFNCICQSAVDRFSCPMAAVSFIDEDRQWFKASVGLSHSSFPRNIAFCAHAIASKEPLVVLDTLKDKRFQHNPMVTGAASVRFYASSPICDLQTGQILGTIFILDTRPRDACNVPLLERLANIVMENINYKVNVKHQQRVRNSESSNNSSRNSTDSEGANSRNADILPECVVCPKSQVVESTTKLQSGPNQLTAIASEAPVNNLEGLLMNLLCRTTETQQQLANQQISMSNALVDHSAKIEQIKNDLARMEARIDSRSNRK